MLKLMVLRVTKRVKVVIVNDDRVVVGQETENDIFYREKRRSRLSSVLSSRCSRLFLGDWAFLYWPQ